MARFEASTSPTSHAPVQFRASVRVTRSPPRQTDGPSRFGPTRTTSPTTEMAESPPTPMERTFNAVTEVGWEPM